MGLFAPGIWLPLLLETLQTLSALPGRGLRGTGDSAALHIRAPAPGTPISASLPATITRTTRTPKSAASLCLRREKRPCVSLNTGRNLLRGKKTHSF